jgi:hypothetical protein
MLSIFSLMKRRIWWEEYIKMDHREMASSRREMFGSG